ncbi:MAG: hypothetical protein LUQ41_05775 [Methanomicrobiales archaeon]|nr:hypothetical protein [Methanomicrobiales archaeon]
MWFASLIATILIEAGLYWIVQRGEFPRLFLYSILINCVTLPPATWIYRYMVPDLFIVEAGVVLVEMLLILALMQIPLSRAFLLSVVANGTTAVVGVLVAFP